MKRIPVNSQHVVNKSSEEEEEETTPEIPELRNLETHAGRSLKGD